MKKYDKHHPQIHLRFRSNTLCKYQSLCKPDTEKMSNNEGTGERGNGGTREHKGNPASPAGYIDWKTRERCHLKLLGTVGTVGNISQTSW